MTSRFKMEPMAKPWHACPVQGCHAYQLPIHLLMCARHWRMVPRQLQIAVYREWCDGVPTANYREARQAAISAVDATLAERMSR